MNTQEYNISGVQQIGVGNNDVHQTWAWYRKYLGMDIPVFDEAAIASLMLPYTGGKPRSRHAILALNMMGGAGVELWQYTDRVAQKAISKLQIGDIGINMALYKSIDIEKSYKILSNTSKCSEIQNYIDGRQCFFSYDLNGNLIKIVESSDWFQKNVSHCGGVYGAVIGVNDIDTSLKFYKDILGFDLVLKDSIVSASSFLPCDEDCRYRSVILTHSEKRKGGFSPLFGDAEIELIQSLDRNPNVIFKDRMWGDLGYIHLCFDVKGMDAIRLKCREYGCPFTVDSGDFDMGDAGGQFAYIEDPDGTLIEFVETHRVPIFKKIGWYLNMKNRSSDKAIPRWMIKALAINRKK